MEGGIDSDITKAFLQIKVCRKDQEVHRFLWDHKGLIRTIKFLRVPFGNKSSPFLLNATVRHHLNTFASTVVIEELKQNLYVDDWLTGADSEKEACDMFTEACEVMSKAGMQLAKWNTNSKLVSDRIYKEFSAKHLVSESIKILGMKWLSVEDSFSFDGVDIPDDLCTTKRIMLSYIARLFDPLGILSPFTMLVKILFQELWRLGIEWDDIVPEEIHKKFVSWINGLEVLKQWTVPRCYFSDCSWNEIKLLELHGFCDSSEKGYGAVIYIRIPQGDSYKVSLVISKAKVAPIKRVTLPRLELKLEHSVIYKCWTDSMVALSWIKGQPHQWKPFVANRVSEIQELTCPSSWNHCSSKQNPADLLTRGMLAEDLIRSQKWIHGPEWLSEKNDSVSSWSYDSRPESNECHTEEVISLVVTSKETYTYIDLERWSTLPKLLRVIRWIMRFITNAKSPQSQRKTNDITYDEMTLAKSRLFKIIQSQHFEEEMYLLKQNKTIPKHSPIAKLTPFLGEDGLLRIKDRLQLSELTFEEKHPIILPNCYVSLLLVRFQHRLLKHAGVATLIASLRSSYWIIGLRRLPKKVKRQCVNCTRFDSSPCNQPIAPLPKLRVKEAHPFTVTGLDYAGPLFSVDKPKDKLYILLFTRAVHLELTDSLALPDFLLAIRRFSARHGLPKVMYSDNAKTFQAVDSTMQRYFGPFKSRMQVHCAPFAMVGRLVGADGKICEVIPQENPWYPLFNQNRTGYYASGNRIMHQLPPHDLCWR